MKGEGDATQSSGSWHCSWLRAQEPTLASARGAAAEQKPREGEAPATVTYATPCIPYPATKACTEADKQDSPSPL